MAYKHPEYLISTEELNRVKGDANVAIFDATVSLVPNPPGYKAISGRDDYQKEHIPGAHFLDLMKDFADTSSGFGFTLPSIDQLQSAFRKAGISNGSRVVFYSTGHMMWATRAWWMLKSSGHENVAVLDGGFAKWKAEELSVSIDSTPISEGDFQVKFDANRWADKAKVLASVSDAETCTINALSPGVYSGEADMNYGRKGHIENSKNVYYDEVLNDGCFKSADDLATLFTQKGVLAKPQVIAYCGGGISATIDALALNLIGHENVAVYDGSMSEWASDASLPLVTGNE